MDNRGGGSWKFRSRFLKCREKTMSMDFASVATYRNISTESVSLVLFPMEADSEGYMEANREVQGPESVSCGQENL
jgi:hypothetical protein